MKIENPKIILLHPGKTGGTSLEHTLRDKYLGLSYKLNAKEPDRNIMFGFDKKINIYLQHACLNLYKAFGVDFKTYKTISTIRRPYERILSCYFYNGKSTKFTFDEFITQELEKCAYVSFEKEYACSHFAPQFYYTHLDDYVVDHIIKLENFRQDSLKAGLNVNYHYSKTAGTRKYKNYMDAYNQKTKDIVYSIYKEDFKLYDYKP
jgi:hypothetical protein